MFYGDEHRDLNLGLAFLHLVAVDAFAFLRLAIDEPTKSDVRLLRREYWKIAGNPTSSAWVKGRQIQDRHRRRQRAMMAKRPARYLEPQFDQARQADADYALKVGLRHDAPLEELLIAPDPHEEVLASFEETLTLERCLARLSSKERAAFDRWWAHEPPLDNAESCARYRAKGKIRFYFESRQIRKKGIDMGVAAVANDLADLKLGQRMQGETLDEILKGVEALRARDLEVINDEEDTDA
jgi:hypothetical protein